MFMSFDSGNSMFSYHKQWWEKFLVCFSKKYWDFSVNSKPIISLFQRNYDFRIFTVRDYFFFIQIEFPMNSVSKTTPKVLSRKLVWNNVKRLNFRARTADVTYCADVNRKEGNDKESMQIPNTFRSKTTKVKKKKAFNSPLRQPPPSPQIKINK